MKIVTVVGARPQFIKVAPVSAALQTAGVDEVLVHTGQHYDANMSDVFFSELGVAAPRYNLEIGSGPHGQQTGRMLESLETVLIGEMPDWVLVYGDTNSTLAGALAAAKLHIPIGHVEAGLRSFNRRMPEEINRVIVDHVAELLFAPTESSVANLSREGISEQKIVRVGDVMFDAVRIFAVRAESRSCVLPQLGVTPKSYALATIHRAENVDDPRRLTAILTGLTAASRELRIVFPVHPRTRQVIARQAADSFRQAGGLLIDPVGYLDMLVLERNAAVIATDSGGVQKEAFFHRVPCVTLRAETEWTELVELGWNTLAPPYQSDAIRAAILSAVGRRGREAVLYGNGHAADQIAHVLAGTAKVGRSKPPEREEV
jgi:UDP-GlcNAc3NAcA epimerase